MARKHSLVVAGAAFSLPLLVVAGRAVLRWARGSAPPVAPLEAPRERVLDGVRSTYARSARWHDLFTRAYTLGGDGELRRRAVRRLELEPGGVVLDVACGTGANFPNLQKAIGPSGRILGIDYSEAMLQRARERVSRQGWRNVTLVRGDAAELRVDEPVDAALTTLAIGLIPNHQEVLRRMVDALKPGGRILVADGQLCRRRYGFLVNPLLRLVAAPWVPAVRREDYFLVKPWKDLSDLLGWDRVHYEEWLWGTVYAISGSKRGAAAWRPTSPRATIATWVAAIML